MRRTAIAGAAAGITLVFAPFAHAETSITTRITVPGASPPPIPILQQLAGFTDEDYRQINEQIGAGWFPGTTPKVVDYPATAGIFWGLNAPSADRAIALGQEALHADIKEAVANGDPVVVTGLSEGTLVIYREQAYLVDAPDAPPADELTFVVYASPQAVADIFPPGTYIPILGYTTQPIPESQYNTIVVFSEYDGLADPPDRLWNLVAVANAFMGAALYEHTPTALSSPSEAVEVSSTTNSRGGTTTTYMIPTEQLPLTRPLRDIGVPDDVVDAIDEPLRKIVDAGYSRNDPEPQTTQTAAAPAAAPKPVLRPSFRATPGQQADASTQKQAAASTPKASSEPEDTPESPASQPKRQKPLGKPAERGYTSSSDATKHERKGWTPHERRAVG